MYYLARGTGRDRRRVSHRLRHDGAEHHVASGEPDRCGRARRSPSACARRGRRRCGINGSATASTSRARRRRTTRSRPSCRPTTARVSARWSPTTSATSLSNEAVLTVSANQAPDGDDHAAGSRHALQRGHGRSTTRGPATDPEDGTLPASAFTWRVDFHHDTHIHPFLASTTGARSGSFTIPTTGETSANVWYRIYLTVRDSGGLTHTSQRDILPRKVAADAGHESGGSAAAAGWAACRRRRSPSTAWSASCATLEAATPQASGGTTYDFVSWSDGGAGVHTISTPAANTTYTATYRARRRHRHRARPRRTSTTRISPAHPSRGSTRRWTSSGASGAAGAGIGADTFSVRWTGQVEPQFTGTYTFYTVSDDGVRLWVTASAREQLDESRRPPRTAARSR